MSQVGSFRHFLRSRSCIMCNCRARWGKARPRPPGEPKSTICTSATPQARRLYPPLTSSSSCTRSRWSTPQTRRQWMVWLTSMRLKRQVSEGRAVPGVILKMTLLFINSGSLSCNDGNLVMTDIPVLQTAMFCESSASSLVTAWVRGVKFHVIHTSSHSCECNISRSLWGIFFI